MTGIEKEKVINGIDVSECNFRLEREGKQKCECTHATGFGVICDCENWQNCYFKQLKRTELAFENLKRKGTIPMVFIDSKLIDKYKQALEQIRKEYTNSIFYQCDKTEEECPCHNCIILGQLDRVQNIVKIIDEALNDRD